MLVVQTSPSLGPTGVDFARSWRAAELDKERVRAVANVAVSLVHGFAARSVRAPRDRCLVVRQVVLETVQLSGWAGSLVPGPQPGVVPFGSCDESEG